ncbi:MAG: ribbon-helix-helix domain-containing protein [Deltaproteobacteria bacterium]|nr:ribbon-helix-helix domain-containing protein [Deltaproteobacteria bacterium]
MPHSVSSVTLTLDRRLLERLQNRADALGLNMTEVIHNAVENELKRLDKMQTSGDNRLTQLEGNILSKAQSMSLSLEDETGQNPTCELCLKPVHGSQRSVEGPLLCTSCLQLARSHTAHSPVTSL